MALTKLSKAQIQHALVAARKQVIKEDRRRASAKSALSPSERAASKLLADWMRASGFDKRSMAALQRQRREELDWALMKQRKADKKRKSRRLDPAHASIAEQAETLHALSALDGFFPFPSRTLEQPTVIRTQPDLSILEGSRIAPFDSSAKVLLDTKTPGTHKLSFVYQLQNNQAAPIVIDAVTFLSASGRLHLREGGTFIPGALGFLDVSGEMEVLAMAQSPIVVQRVRQLFRSIIAINRPFYVDGVVDVSVSRGEQLVATFCTIPAQTAALFVVSLVIETDFEPGRAVADFATGNFQVRCPLVVVSLRSSPPQAPSILG
jgi:hypothetical protein